MILMSIDGSTKATGVGIFQDSKLIRYECIFADDINMLNRIPVMTKRIHELIEEYKVTTIVMEDVIPDDVKHNQAVYKALMYLQGAISLTANESHLTIQFYTSAAWRKLVGIKTGRGVKRDTLKKASITLVKESYDISVSDDIADAICIGLAFIKEQGIGQDTFVLL